MAKPLVPTVPDLYARWEAWVYETYSNPTNTLFIHSVVQDLGYHPTEAQIEARVQATKWSPGTKQYALRVLRKFYNKPKA